MSDKNRSSRRGSSAGGSGFDKKNPERKSSRSQGRGKRASGSSGKAKSSSRGKSSSKARKGYDRTGGAGRTRTYRSDRSERGRSAEPDAGRTDGSGKRRRDLKGAAVDLPNWVIEALERVTPKERVPGALEALGEASAAMSDGRYHAAVRHARAAKELSSQDATVRETLGLAAYRVGDWGTAIRELRAYRRMAGDPSHLPIEMDVLRAQGRDRDVANAWETLRQMDARPMVEREGRVVYGSYLLDRGEAQAAWDITGPGKIRDNADESEYRVWYVAARAAVRLHDVQTARQLANAIVRNDPGFPGIEALEREIAAAG